MVLMVLDHVRDFFTNQRFDPTDLTRTTTSLFLARWVTHLCAPIFILLAGTSAWFVGQRRGKAELSRFLLSRGLWLVVLEFTVVNFAWYFNFRYELGFVGQVIWAIGISMIALAGLIWLPGWALAGVSAVMIAGHNLLDQVVVSDRWQPLWALLHVHQALPQYHYYVSYPIIPWIGVMAAGYLLGPLLKQVPARRERGLMALGSAALAGFVVLRLINRYGDPAPWSDQGATVRTMLSFFNVTKYPASLLYLLVTLGIGMLLLVGMERMQGWLAEALAVFGRVPLFFYVAHLYLVHALAVAAGWSIGFPVSAMTRTWRDLPADYGFDLWVVLVVWLAVVVVLYPASRWYDQVKQTGRGWWWSYL